MANLANLQPGSRFIIIDTVGGLLVATALERLGGEAVTNTELALITTIGDGRVLYLSESDTPPQFPILNILNMPAEHISILKYLDWAAADEDHEPSEYMAIIEGSLLNNHSVRAPFETETGEYRSIGQKERYEKRKNALEAHENLREELFAGEWDGYVSHLKVYVPINLSK